MNKEDFDNFFDEIYNKVLFVDDFVEAYESEGITIEINDGKVVNILM